MNFQTVLDWIIYSSKDEEKVSRSLKWAGSALVMFLAWKGVDVSVAQGLVDQGVKGGVDFWLGLGQFVTNAGMVLAVAAKIWNLAMGDKLGKKF